jgi:hypothetical protein
VGAYKFIDSALQNTKLEMYGQGTVNTSEAAWYTIVSLKYMFFVTGQAFLKKVLSAFTSLQGSV